jgi:hypothetical protein
MEATDPRVTELLDKQAITDAVYRYGRWTLDGDVATSESYDHVTLRRVGEDGRCIDSRNLGRYVDRWERRAGEWRIIERVDLHDFDQSGPSAGEFPTTGRRDRLDASYFLPRQ